MVLALATANGPCVTNGTMGRPSHQPGTEGGEATCGINPERDETAGGIRQGDQPRPQQGDRSGAALVQMSRDETTC